MSLLRIKCLSLGPLDSNCYIVHNARTRSALVIDPGETDAVRDYVYTNDLNVKAILLTHLHVDNANGIGGLQKACSQRYPTIHIYCHEAENALWTEYRHTASWMGVPVPDSFPDQPDQTFEAGEIWDLDGIALESIHTPGHTDGSVCFVIHEEKIIFTGDTLMHDGIGRSDFKESHIPSFKTSLAMLRSDFAEYLAYPGHGPSFRVADAVSDEAVAY